MFFLGRTWRFAAMMDPNVDIFISRDLDSAILPREVKFDEISTKVCQSALTESEAYVVSFYCFNFFRSQQLKNGWNLGEHFISWGTIHHTMVYSIAFLYYSYLVDVILSPRPLNFYNNFSLHFLQAIWWLVYGAQKTQITATNCDLCQTPCSNHCQGITGTLIKLYSGELYGQRPSKTASSTIRTRVSLTSLIQFIWFNRSRPDVKINFMLVGEPSRDPQIRLASSRVRKSVDSRPNGHFVDVNRYYHRLGPRTKACKNVQV